MRLLPRARNVLERWWPLDIKQTELFESMMELLPDHNQRPQ
jgi:hypothetical protein